MIKCDLLTQIFGMYKHIKYLINCEIKLQIKKICNGILQNFTLFLYSSSIYNETFNYFFNKINVHIESRFFMVLISQYHLVFYL